MRVLIVISSFLFIVRAVSAQEIDPGTDAQKESGKELYGQFCALCHGANGDGKGPATPYLRPAPRDFTSAMYKFRTTESGEVPLDEDIRRSIRNGMPYTSMPAWPGLSDDEITDLMYYLKSFSEDFEYFGDVVAIDLPEPPKMTPESIERGKEVYLENQCSDCHGLDGRSNGKSSPTLKDVWGSPILATDMTKRWTYRGGSSREDIYRTFMTGLDGTPMPAYKIELVEDRWNLVDYVYSLSRDRPEYSTMVSALPVLASPEELMSPEIYRGTMPALFPVVGQVIESRRAFFSGINEIEVRAVVTDQYVGLMLRWNDMSPETSGQNGIDLEVPPWLEDTDSTQTFSDALAVQFPTSKSEDGTQSYFLFGDRKMSTDIWYRNLAKAEAEHLIGRGTFDVRPGGPAVESWAESYEGRWTVILRRERVVDSHVAFEEGEFIPIAFSVWDGFSRERGSRRGITSWYPLYVSPAVTRSPVVPVAASGILTFLAGLVSMVILRRKYGVDGNRQVFEFESEFAIPTRSIGRVVARKIEREGLEDAVVACRRLWSDQRERYNFRANQLNRLADGYLRSGKVDQALILFSLNAELNPDTVSIEEGFARAYLQKGNLDHAVRSLDRACTLDPGNSDRENMLARLKKG